MSVPIISTLSRKYVVWCLCFLLSSFSTAEYGAEQLYGHDILFDEHTVLFTEGTKDDIEGVSGTSWSQRFPFIHIDSSDSCEIFG